MGIRETKSTTCNRDCPDACRIEATVEDGTIISLKGASDHPMTQSFICARTRRYLEFQNERGPGGQRITKPLVKKNGVFEEICFEEAIELVANRFVDVRSRWGASAILHYRSGGSLGKLKVLTDAFFSHFGPVTTTTGDICSGAPSAAQKADFGICESNDVSDLLNAKTIVLWGKNIFTSSPHLIPWIKRAKKQGANVILIDPVSHRTKTLADHYVQIRPGQDAALAFAVARTLFDQKTIHAEARRYCDHFHAFRDVVCARSATAWAEDAEVDMETLRLLVQSFEDGGCTTLLGWGLGRRTNGSYAVRAIDALHLVSGNIGEPGAGVSFSYQGKGVLDKTALDLKPSPRTFSEPRLGHDILAASHHPIRAAMISCANPVAMLPDSHTTAKALSSIDFLVVLDSRHTDTTRLADVILPTATLLEDDDLLGAYGHHYIGVSRPIVPPPPDVKTDLEIIQALAQKTGLGTLMAGSAQEWKARLLHPDIKKAGVTIEQIYETPTRHPGVGRIAHLHRQFSTRTTKAQLVHCAPPPMPVPPDRDVRVPKESIPLMCMSVSTAESQSSQWSEPPQQPIEVRVHPDVDAGIGHEGRGWLESSLGQIQVRVIHDASQRRDVVLVPKGGGFFSKSAANALIEAKVTDAGEGAAYYDQYVFLRTQERPVEPSNLMESENSV